MIACGKMHLNNVFSAFGLNNILFFSNKKNTELYFVLKNNINCPNNNQGTRSVRAHPILEHDSGHDYDSYI